MTPYQLFMLVLCVWALVVLGAGVFTRWSDSTGTILAYADAVVCVFFLVDFLKSLREAQDKCAAGAGLDDIVPKLSLPAETIATFQPTAANIT